MVLDRALTVGILLFQNVTTLDFMGPGTYLEMLEPIAGQKVEFYTIADKTGGPIQPLNLIPLEASLSIDEAPFDWDILLIPGGPGATPMAKSEKVLEYVRQAANQSTDVLTVCTGARISGAAGLLDGKNATTNKNRFTEISGLYPEVNWIQQARWVVDGKWWTSSGVSAGIDMGHAYVAERFGAEVATKIARVIEYVPDLDADNDPFAPKPTTSPAPSATPAPTRTVAPITNNGTLRIGTIMFENVTSLDFMGPNAYLEMIQPVLGQKTHFYSIAEKAGGPIQPLNLIPLHATLSIDEAPVDWDILIIPGGPGTTAVVKNDKFMTYVKKAAENAKEVLTVCTGGRILGATGLLDGKKATTNKLRFNEISTAYPGVNWVQRARWVVDGKWWTSSGMSAGLDMGHAYVAAKFGEASATKVAAAIEYVASKDPLNDPFAPSTVPSPSDAVAPEATPAPSLTSPIKCRTRQ
ncbi:hypothetical protein Poli38472_002913 [Pythium oligandrum]|uniref:DJ-1/PfpI domain-containing protein n=1 Tax=Pythium oligandrum TaxID=41045 RepID=A0A8K1C5V7_PYTOL|nr:hypothetical protein Poli38472_002913 [Pythium oligandrum]|eukprot:TMW56988.1 hypothetical protein Poli38472_002913 [Pythium oligandrum]